MLAIALATGCGGGEGPEPSPTGTATEVPTPAPSATPSAEPAATPSPAPTAEGTPEAPPVELEPGVTLDREGVLDLAIPRGGRSGIEPLSLAGEPPPPCAALVVAFSWQVREPYPPEGIDLRVLASRMGSTNEIGRGPSGTASVSCFFVEFVNTSDVDIVVQFRYAAGRFEG